MSRRDTSGKARVCLPAVDLCAFGTSAVGMTIGRQNSKTLVNYYIYVLKSDRNDDIYIGSTANLKKRIILHNQGKVKSTKAYHPWKLLEYYERSSRSEAMKYEKFLKTGQQKEIIRKRYKTAP